MHIFGKEEWFNFEINLGQVHYCHSILSFHIDISLCHLQLVMSCHVIFIKWPHLYVCHYTTTAYVIIPQPRQSLHPMWNTYMWPFLVIQWHIQRSLDGHFDLHY
jgi:hypothetical protein